jgi:heat shock protein HtpX
MEGGRMDRLWSRLNEWIGSKRNAAIYEEVRGDIISVFLSTLFRLLAYGFATLFYGLVIWTAYQTVITFLTLQTLGDFCEGIFLAGLTFILAPRIYRFREPLLDREQYPAIYQVIDEITTYLGASPIDGIAVEERFTAAYTISGVRRRKLVVVGLPLFAALTPREKLAVLSHEIGHHANRDITRSSYLGGVQRALGRLYVSLYPKTDHSNVLAFLAFLLEWLRKGLAYIVLLLWYVMGFAVWKESQKAEYGADYAAASTAGASAASSALKKMCYAPTYYYALDSVAQYRYTDNIFEDFRSRADRVPGREVERIRIVTEMMENSVEAGHPPIRYRLAYINEKLPNTEAVISSELLNRMEKEFLELESIYGKRILSDYRSYFYEA